MSKLYFYYSAMNAGKTTNLLQCNYNYQECKMVSLMFKPSLIPGDKIQSRIGIEGKCISFESNFNFFDFINNLVTSGCSGENLDHYFNIGYKNSEKIDFFKKKINCILIDEAQFLTKEQVTQLTKIVDFLGISVLTYGLRTDFMGETFIGSKYLLAWSDEIIELKTMCMYGSFISSTSINDDLIEFCNKKATMNIKILNGNIVKFGDQIDVGGNEKYISMCRKHYNMLIFS